MRPRLAFVGLGWIGRHRLSAIVDSGVAEVVALADPDQHSREQAAALAPSALCADSFDAALATAPDGIVLATPSAMHSAQTIAALDAGVAVFCQKPLGRTAPEVQTVIDAARRANRLVGVDFSYRYTEGLTRLRDIVLSGGIGEVFALDLTFHNAYGPDKPWFYDLSQAGGGCLLDLGTHLVDFLHWTIPGMPAHVTGVTYAGGQRLSQPATVVEDFAAGQVDFVNGAVARVTCSWRVSAGCDAQIAISAFGTRGGVGFRNVGGSFYDFVAERYAGTRTETLCSPPDDWGGRAAVAWAARLARSQDYDAELETAWQVASTIDRIYGRSDGAASAI